MTSTNNRASLLAGLRTGGVRSASQPSIVPHTAAPGGSFNVPRYPPFSNRQVYEDDEDQLAEMFNQSMHMNNNRRMMQQPATASALDGFSNKFQHQQAASISGMRSVSGAMNMAMMQQDPASLHEMLKLQAQVQQAQQAQLQAELLAQAQIQQIQLLQQQQLQQQLQQQIQQQQQQQARAARRASGYGEPVTAGPLNTTFDMRSRMPADFSYEDLGQVPMTAALGGKFGGRTGQSALNPNANVFTLRPEPMDDVEPPRTASGRTTVISGGATLGSTITPSKSDSALSWRRPSLGNSKAPGLSPAGKISPPALDESTSVASGKVRPQPLRFNGGLSGPLGVSIESTEEGDESDGSFTSDSVHVGNGRGTTEEDSSPSTPPSAGSSGSLPSREEAAKKLYEGLGIGRPVPSAPAPFVAAPPKLSQPIRQPRGPPASVDELGNRNFAARMPKILVAEA